MVPSVSIVVPIFNMERYLTKCLDSIVNQTLRDIEIILVNDGSTDHSGEIADEYASRDERIKVIHKKNGGVSSARNTGLTRATGQYIGFVDPDDWISLDMYEKLYNSAAQGSFDIVVCHNYNHYIEKGYFEVDTFKIKDNTLRNIRRHALKDDYFSAVWNMIFKKSLVSEINCNFPEELTVWEDSCFVLKAMCATDKIKYLTESYYHYRKPYRKQKYIHNLFENLLHLQEIRNQCVKKWGDNVFNEDECIEALFCKRVVLCLEQEMNINMDVNKLRNIEKIMSHPLTQQMFKHLKKNKFAYKQIGWHAFFLLQLTVYKNKFFVIFANTIFNILRMVKKTNKVLFKSFLALNTKKSISEEQEKVT